MRCGTWHHVGGAEVTEPMLEERDRLPGLRAQAAGDARPVVLTRQHPPADVVDQRLVQPDHGVRRDPGRDVVWAGAGLLGDERRQSGGVARVDLLLAREQRGAAGDQADDRERAFAGVGGVGGQQAARLGDEALEGRQAAVEEVFLGREVVEHRLARDVGFARDVGDGDGVKAVLLEQAARRLRDQAPGLLLLALAEPWLVIHGDYLTLSENLHLVYV